MKILHPRDFRCYKNGRYARDLRVGQEPMVCPELEMVLMMMMMMVMMMKLARVTVPWRCVFFLLLCCFLMETPKCSPNCGMVICYMGADCYILCRP